MILCSLSIFHLLFIVLLFVDVRLSHHNKIYLLTYLQNITLNRLMHY